MWIGFLIWTIAAVSFAAVGIYARKSPKAVGFFTSEKPANIENVPRYNHAVARLWFVSAAVFELLGLPLLAQRKNTILILLSVGVLFLLIIVMIAVYLKIEERYRVK